MPRSVGKERGVLEKLRLLGSFVFSFLLILGGYYFFYVQKKSSYLVSRNFRFLASMGAQVEGSVRSQGTVLKNLALKKEFVELLALDPEDKKVQKERPEELRQRRNVLESLAPAFEKVEVVEVKTSDKQTSHQSQYHLVSELDGYFLGFSHRVPETEDQRLQGRVALAGILEPLFRSSQAFDSLLLANAEGKVFFQKGASGKGASDLNTTHLATLLDGDRRPEAVSAQKGEKGGQTDLRARSPLFSASDFRDVRLSGREYRLFVEPVSLPIREEATSDSSKPSIRHVWLVCGLAPKRDFFYKSFAVSSALVGSILGLLVLSILSWPFVKLSLLGERQRVHVYDVLLLGVCSLMGISVVTLFVCDFLAYRALQDSAEQQLEVFAEEISGHLHQEVRQAYQQLRDLEVKPRAVPSQTGEQAAISAIIRSEDEEKERANILAEVVFDSYPFADTFMVINDEGKQRRKWAAGSVAPPRISVAPRDYFRQALQEETWGPSRQSNESPLGPFVLQSTVGLTDGVRAGVISKPTEEELRGSYPVAALAIPMISLINPVLPPGFEFAVIDQADEGTVLFHSDSRRNLTESFFVETDQDRRLRAAVFARRSETLAIRYWGEDYLARVKPVKDMPWTIIALRDKRVLRAVNVDWMTTTALFIGFYAGAVTLALVLLTVIQPSYRAPWMWPEPRRSLDYLQLAAAFSLLALAFAWIIQLSPGGEGLLRTGVLVPAVAWASTHHMLAAPRRSKRGGQLLGLLCLTALFYQVWQVTKEPGRFLQGLGASALLLAGCGLAFIPLDSRWRLGTRLRAALGDRVLATRSYPAAGILLLLLTAALPTWSFFKAAHQVHFANLVKHGQLKMMQALQQRDTRIRRDYRDRRGLRRGCLLDDRLSVTPKATPLAGLDVYAAPFFGTEVYLAREERQVPSECDTWRSGGATWKAPAPVTLPPHDHHFSGRDSRRVFSEFLEGILPPSSDYAKEMRELLHEGAADSAWHWHEEADRLTLYVPGYPGGGELRLESRLTDSMKESRREAPAQIGSRLAKAGVSLLGEGVGGTGRLLGLILVLLPFLLYVVLFISRKVFLLDVLEPLWSGKRGDLPATMGSNLFLISRNEKWPLDRRKFFCLHFRDLEGDRAAWAGRRLELIRSLPDRNILVEGFEYKISDQAFNEIKLAFLEGLLEEDQRTVVVLSTVSPFAQERPRDSRRRTGTAPRFGASWKERWQTLLASFTLIDLDLRSQSSAETECQEGRRPSNSDLLRQESGNDPFLQQVAEELKGQASSMDREQLIEEFGERAESRYRSIWASCSRDEQVVLEHLAEEGFVNEKNRRLVRRLMVRGLVQRGPNLRLFNETFRRFVISSGCKHEVLDLERRAEPSAWDRFRWPFFIGLSATFMFFFATQQSLLEGTLATISGLAAGLPALIKLLDLVGGRGSGRSEIVR